MFGPEAVCVCAECSQGCVLVIFGRHTILHHQQKHLKRLLPLYLTYERFTSFWRKTSTREDEFTWKITALKKDFATTRRRKHSN